MKSIYFLIVMLFSVHISVAKDFYVSPNGNNKNPGTKKQPFASIAHARDQVFEWNQTNETEDVTVWIAGGEYRLSETLVFGLEDSAKPGQTIKYAALPGETPIINSDVNISGWKMLKNSPLGLPRVAKGKIWVATVPEECVDLKVIFNSKKMLPRAKTKAIAHIRTTQSWVGIEEEHTSLPFKKETTKNLFNPENAEIVVIPSAPWTMNILPVKSVDNKTDMVYLDAKSTYALAAPRFYMGPEAIWVENTFAGLDQPGKWVFDAEKKLLYYWPINDKKPGDDIVAPQLIEFIRIEGEIDYDGATDIPVKGLIFNGLTFMHGNRFNSFGKTGRGLQHDWERFDESTALIRFRGTEDCAVDNCTFTQSGGAAIRLDLYAQNNRIYNNKISEIGGGGILLAGYGPGSKDVNKGNIVSNNLIHHIGKLWWHSLGIWAWQSGHNLISHNTIHNVPYTAIAVTGRIGWDKSGIAECSKTVRWHETGAFTGKELWEERERFLHGRQNVISNNDIHHVMEVMQDGNAVYISGAGHGNIVRGNYVHDTGLITPWPAGEAIRCDDDQHEVYIENNVVFNYGTHGVGIATKGRNHIFNNIVACPPYRISRGMLSFEADSMLISGSKVFHNIFYGNGADQPFVFNYKSQVVKIDKNVYFNSSDSEAANEYLKYARNKGWEEKSIQTDPMFVDIENRNFQLNPNSPAIKLGFRPFKFEAGRK